LSPNLVVPENIAPAIGVLKDPPMASINVLNAAYARFIAQKDASGKMRRTIFKLIFSGVRGAVFAAESAPQR